MNINNTAKQLEGIQTVSSVMKKLSIGRRTAVNYLSKLRDSGLVKTSYGNNKIRLYTVTTVKKPETGYPGLYDVINENSKMKIRTKYDYRMHMHKLSVEEAIVKAIQTKKTRTILACLGLFSKITNWHRMYEFAKQHRITRKVGALYDIAATKMRVRRMDKRTRKALSKGRVDSRYIIENAKSRDFKNIEDEWKVFIPFNSIDLEEYA
jgi:hypothetical protein